MSYLSDYRRMVGFQPRLQESAEPSNAHLALLKKIAKKAKVGDYSPREVGEALAFVEPGWKADVTVGLLPLKDEPLNPVFKTPGFWGKWADDHGLDSASVYGTDMYLSFVYSPEWPADSNYPENRRRTEKPSKEEIAKAIDAFLEMVLVQTTQDKNPVNPEEGRIYINPLGKPKIAEEPIHPAGHWRFGKDAKSLSVSWKLSNVRKAKEAVRITAPDGSFIDIDKPSPSLWTWLYKTDIDKKAQAYLDGGGHTAADAKKKLMKGYSTNEVVGTCGICGNVQKLKGGGQLVLHGYTRPGYGWIQGSCFGVGYRAWELSNESGVAYLKALKGTIEQQKKKLVDLESAKSFTVWIDDSRLVDGSGRGYREYKVSADGFELADEKKYSYDDVKRKRGKTVSPYNLDAKEAQKTFDEVKDYALYSEGKTLQQMLETQTLMQQAVTNWTAQPLPGASLESTDYLRSYRRMAGLTGYTGLRSK